MSGGAVDKRSPQVDSFSPCGPDSRRHSQQFRDARLALSPHIFPACPGIARSRGPAGGQDGDGGDLARGRGRTLGSGRLKIRSITSRGSAEIDVKFEWGLDMVAAILQVQSAISQIAPQLPAGDPYQRPHDGPYRLPRPRLRLSSKPSHRSISVTSPNISCVPGFRPCGEWPPWGSRGVISRNTT